MRQIFLASIALISLTAAARAQLQLPGAVGAPTAAGQTLAPPPRSVAPRGAAEASDVSDHFIPARPPGLETVVDRTLALHGARGALMLQKSGDALSVGRLTLAGDKISRPNQACEVTLTASGAIALRPLGAPDGLSRFALESSACALTFDVLDGAIRAASAQGACLFTAADCRVEAAGLWGPAGASYGDKELKALEKTRGATEKAMRDHFRALLIRLKKDKPAADAAIRQQAAFSSERALACRDYDHEESTGYCALRLTEARDYLLQARLGELVAKKAEKKDPKADAPRHKPVKPAPAAAPEPKPPF